MSDAESESKSPAFQEPTWRRVCGRTLSTCPPYQSDYQGEKIYFCTTFCLEAFLADPDRFYAAHSRPRPTFDVAEWLKSFPLKD